MEMLPVLMEVMVTPLMAAVDCAKIFCGESRLGIIARSARARSLGILRLILFPVRIVWSLYNIILFLSSYFHNINIFLSCALYSMIFFLSTPLKQYYPRSKTTDEKTRQMHP